MKKLFAVAAIFAAFVVPAMAFGPGDCTGTIQTQIGTVVHYRSTTGVIRPGFLHNSTSGHPTHWDIVIFNATGAATLVTNVDVDQTESTNNTYAVLSCVVPF